MNTLRNFKQFITESKDRKISIDQIEVGNEVSYKRENGSTETKKVHHVDYKDGKIYFIDHNKEEFSKGIDEIIAIEN